MVPTSVSTRMPLLPSTTTGDGGMRSCAMWMGVDMACGMAALLSTTLNIPLAAIALTITVFGTSYILPAVTGSSIAFILFKGNTVYTYFAASEERRANGNNE